MEDNHNLIYSFLQKYHLTVDDYYGLAAIGLCRAAMTFDSKKANFSTYAYRCMYTAVMNEERKKRQAHTIPENKILYYQSEIEDDDGKASSFISYIPSRENVEDNVLAKIIFEEYASKLNDRDKKIFVLFREGYKQKEIGKMLGYSQSQVSRVKKNLNEYLKKDAHI